MSQDLMVETLTREGLHTWLEKGISNVAFLSLGLGLDNLASRAFTEAKANTHYLLYSLQIIMVLCCII